MMRSIKDSVEVLLVLIKYLNLLLLPGALLLPGGPQRLLPALLPLPLRVGGVGPRAVQPRQPRHAGHQLQPPPGLGGVLLHPEVLAVQHRVPQVSSLLDRGPHTTWNETWKSYGFFNNFSRQCQ